MTSQFLDKDDKRILLSELMQMILAFIFAGVAISLLLVTGIIFLSNSNNEFVTTNQTSLQILLSIIVLTTLIVIGWIKLSKPLKDILIGQKLTKMGIVTNKSINSNYGYHEKYWSRPCFTAKIS